ncbi:MAG: nicotinate-nucleotide adenylyltransferase [Methylococcaceae bacterium]|nr:MAG: nicotinate-nucleotide adenylyltransferase [Methylococcaceae bacterium]
MTGILGGTFDPIHHGHLRIALEVQEILALREVRFIPCRQPPHRGEPSATAEQRLHLLRLALGDMPGFVTDTRELERPGPSYMVDTLASLRAELGAAPLCLILGYDAFLGLPGWHRWRNLLDYAHWVVVRRPGPAPVPTGALAALQQERRLEPEQLHTAACGGICFLPVSQLDISATQIRTLLRSGRNPSYLLPDAVLRFIEQTGLYGCDHSPRSTRSPVT